MNKCYIALLLGVVGCATTSQIEESNIRILDLEKKIARIEGDLYRVEVKSAPKQQAAEQKFVPAKEVEQNVIDTKIDAFLKEYLGVAFGDSIEKYPKTNGFRHEDCREITVQKRFQYFDKACAGFCDGKLCWVEFFANIDKKYSIDSVNQRIDQTLADMAVTFGIASDSFNPGRLCVRRAGARSSYSLFKFNNARHAPEGFMRYGATIMNIALRKKLQAEKSVRERASGEQLPELK